MPTAARRRFDEELARARRTTDRDEAWAALTIAHVLGQAWAGPHVRSHVAMLGRAVRERDGREVVGQLVRIVVAAPGSWTGRIPVGNSGRADMALMATQDVPDDLAELLR